MRQVKRPKPPACLGKRNITDSILSKINRAGDADSAIYRNKEVVKALVAMYHNKCYICEKPLKSGEAHVEHFVPYSKSTARLAYQWKNLHWSCGRCNNRKTGKIYKRTKGNIVTDTLLIDPSSPKPKPLKQLIRFDRKLDAIAVEVDRAGRVSNTIGFLNSIDIKAERFDFKEELEETLREGSAVATWREILKHDYFDTALWPQKLVGYYMDALEKADSLWLAFLDAKSPYCSSMRDYLTACKIDPMDIRRLGEFYRVTKRLPMLYSND